VRNLLTKEENDQSLQFTLNAWKIRDTLKKQIGKGKFVLAEYEKIKRIIPISIYFLIIFYYYHTGYRVKAINQHVYSVISSLCIPKMN
jgi:hypothetical protein